MMAPLRGALAQCLQPAACSLTPAGADGPNLVCVMKAVRLAIGGAIVIVLGRMAAAGRLPRNLLAGIRIPSTMRSDEAWLAGHRAAASALTVAGAGPVVVAVVVAAIPPGRNAETVLFRIATAWLLSWIGLATVQASRAARATDVG